jgi:hypothetical protein
MYRQTDQTETWSLVKVKHVCVYTNVCIDRQTRPTDLVLGECQSPLGALRSCVGHLTARIRNINLRRCTCTQCQLHVSTFCTYIFHAAYICVSCVRQGYALQKNGSPLMNKCMNSTCTCECMRTGASMCVRKPCKNTPKHKIYIYIYTHTHTY